MRAFGVPGVVAGGAHTGGMALIDPPPDLRRLTAFMAGLPQCPHGCHFSRVYNSPTLRAPSADDTIGDQVGEIIERYEREADGMLQRHLAEDHRLPADLRAAGICIEWAEER